MGFGAGSTIRLAGIVTGMAALSLAVMTLGSMSPRQPAAPSGAVDPSHDAFVTFGLSINQPSAWPGHTLVAPVKSPTTYLIDLQGRVVGSWEADCQ